MAKRLRATMAIYLPPSDTLLSTKQTGQVTEDLDTPWSPLATYTHANNHPLEECPDLDLPSSLTSMPTVATAATSPDLTAALPFDLHYTSPFVNPLHSHLTLSPAYGSYELSHLTAVRPSGTRARARGNSRLRSTASAPTLSPHLHRTAASLPSVDLVYRSYPSNHPKDHLTAKPSTSPRTCATTSEAVPSIPSRSEKIKKEVERTWKLVRGPVRDIPDRPLEAQSQSPQSHVTSSDLLFRPLGDLASRPINVVEDEYRLYHPPPLFDLSPSSPLPIVKASYELALRTKAAATDPDFWVNTPERKAKAAAGSAPPPTGSIIDRVCLLPESSGANRSAKVPHSAGVSAETREIGPHAVLAVSPVQVVETKVAKRKISKPEISSSVPIPVCDDDASYCISDDEDGDDPYEMVDFAESPIEVQEKKRKTKGFKDSRMANEDEQSGRQVDAAEADAGEVQDPAEIEANTFNVVTHNILTGEARNRNGILLFPERIF